MKSKAFPVYNIKEFSKSVRNGDFYANTLSAHLTQHAHLVSVAHKHNFYVSGFFTNGHGKHEIDFTKYPVKRGSIFMLAPGQVHDWTLSKDIEGYTFFHTREFYDFYFSYEKVEHYPFYSGVYDSSLIILKNTFRKEIEALYRGLVEEYQQHKLMKYHKICSMLNILYIELTRYRIPNALAGKQNQRQLSKVRKLEGLIDSHYKSVKYPKDYAEMMNMSEKHLNRLCKEFLNKTISELISDRIVLEAKRMLVHSSESVSQIAIDLGYFENSYFFRMFKKKTGKTPLEFINKNRSK